MTPLCTPESIAADDARLERRKKKDRKKRIGEKNTTRGCKMQNRDKSTEGRRKEKKKEKEIKEKAKRPTPSLNH